MNVGLSDQVRAKARDLYIQPAKLARRREFAISVKDLLKDLRADGFPENHARQVCMALQSEKLLRDNQLQIQRVDGPPSKTSTTVVVHYRVSGRSGLPPLGEPSSVWSGARPATEDERQRALAALERLRGSMKDVIAERGGSEGYIRWVRGYDEEEA